MSEFYLGALMAGLLFGGLGMPFAFYVGFVCQSKDAARYRFIRAHIGGELFARPGCKPKAMVKFPESDRRGGMQWAIPDADELDRYIDSWGRT